jgi:hypothetical protein
MPGPEALSDAERKAAVAAFEKLGICTQLAEAAAGLGWKAPSSIQEQAIPQLLAGEAADQRGSPGELAAGRGSPAAVSAVEGHSSPVADSVQRNAQCTQPTLSSAG